MPKSLRRLFLASVAAVALIFLTASAPMMVGTARHSFIAAEAKRVEISESLSEQFQSADERRAAKRRTEGEAAADANAAVAPRSLSPSLSPSASILARRKAFTRNPKTGVPELTTDKLEVLADQIFDGIVTDVHYRDHHPYRTHAHASMRGWVDRYYRITVLVTTVIHLREGGPLALTGYSDHERRRLADTNAARGGVREHAHAIEEGQLVDVMMWEALKRPAANEGPTGGLLKGLEIGYVLFPKRADPNVEYRFFTSGLAHRMFTYSEAYPTAGLELPAFEALIPNGVQIVKEDGTGDDTPMQQRRSRSKSVRFGDL